ncbi:MAG: hypothetical protein ABI724_02030 [Betaproteobacteria bacterium]
MTNATSSTDSPRMVTGMFEDRDTAERAFLAITSRGYDKDDINLVMEDDTRERYFPASREHESELGNKASEGEGVGGPLGGTLGTIFTAAAAVGTFLLFPALGLAAAGPMAAALAGAGTAAVAGGLVGVLHDWGIPAARIDAYQAAIKSGGILMGVTPRTREDAGHIEHDWKTIGAKHVEV